MQDKEGSRFGRKFWALIGLAALLIYVAWIGAPYLRSVVVRDAAVTTWINTASAPISGYIEDNALHAGDSVVQDGRIAVLENPMADRTPVVKAEADVERAKQRVSGLQGLMSSLDSDPVARSRAAMELADAKVDADAAEKILESVKTTYEAARRQPVKAPPDSYIWSLVASPGDFVQAGAPVATWVNCAIMLIDVPVSDVELALLQTDAPAKVVIEGDRQVRDGKVYLTRGAASTVGASDLAAIAKGRQPGVGQVLVQINPSHADWEACPIGAAAYVDFPEVGVLDMLRARLRL
jgi:multidrug resistance efflux pump